MCLFQFQRGLPIHREAEVEETSYYVVPTTTLDPQHPTPSRTQTLDLNPLRIGLPWIRDLVAVADQS